MAKKKISYKDKSPIFWSRSDFGEAIATEDIIVLERLARQLSTARDDFIAEQEGKIAKSRRVMAYYESLQDGEDYSVLIQSCQDGIDTAQGLIENATLGEKDKDWTRTMREEIILKISDII